MYYTYGFSLDHILFGFLNLKWFRIGSCERVKELARRTTRESTEPKKKV